MLVRSPQLRLMIADLFPLLVGLGLTEIPMQVAPAFKPSVHELAPISSNSAAWGPLRIASVHRGVAKSPEFETGVSRGVPDERGAVISSWAGDEVKKLRAAGCGSILNFVVRASLQDGSRQSPSPVAVQNEAMMTF